MMLSPYRFSRSLGHAARGFSRAFQGEHSFRIHVVVALLVTVLLFLLDLDPLAIGVVVLVIGLVLMLELVNSAIERLVGMMEPRVHPAVAAIKDLMAAAVLTVAVTALLIGCLVFIPALTP